MDLDNPEYTRWMDGDTHCWGVTPEYKYELILDYARRFNINTFIETGTYQGDSIEYVRQHFSYLHSIELSPEWFERCQKRFSGVSNVRLSFGNSGEVLKDILADLPDDSKLFWLDAHPSGGDTVGVGSPLEKELEAILESQSNGIILIDDLQDCWTHDWAEIARRTISRYPGWQQEIKHGIMRAVKMETK